VQISKCVMKVPSFNPFRTITVIKKDLKFSVSTCRQSVKSAKLRLCKYPVGGVKASLCCLGPRGSSRVHLQPHSIMSQMISQSHGTNT
jgi:hypothetical protein